ncbi:unnamed protein product [Symbiodinium microadriaticum]|nr:unnamed protein product [Symbiodinium microadriaticum]CAE7599483.1 unnamed protein product [Symbiodinium sp. KB8]
MAPKPKKLRLLLGFAHFESRMIAWQSKRLRALRRSQSKLKHLVAACDSCFRDELQELKRRRDFLTELGIATSEMEELKKSVGKIRALSPSVGSRVAHGLQPVVDLDQLQALILRLGGAQVRQDQDELRWAWYQKKRAKTLSRPSK